MAAITFEPGKAAGSISGWPKAHCSSANLFESSPSPWIASRIDWVGESRSVKSEGSQARKKTAAPRLARVARTLVSGSAQSSQRYWASRMKSAV